MKRTKTMRMAAVLFALVLITSCFVGNTFAKYVTSGEGTDKARVAKFGVTITPETNPAFATSYAVDASDYAVTGTVSVSASEKVVAPGTKGKLAGITVAGTPEVAVRIEYKVDTLTLSNWTIDTDTFYCPLVFNIGSTKVDGATYSTADALIAALKTAIEKKNDYAPGTDLSSDAIAVTWEWPFTTSAANDVKDTKLGNAATPAEIEFKISCTVTQID